MGKPLQQPALLHAAALTRIESAVAAAEAKTSCEFVVVLSPAASRYEGRALRAGALAALATFVAIYWILALAFDQQPEALRLLAEAVAMGALVTWACSHFAPLRRLLSGRLYRSLCVTQAAHATFFEQKVAWTRAHNALLLFVSVTEGEARLLADVGLVAKAGEPALNEIHVLLNEARGGDGVALIEQALGRLAELCAAHFPRAADDVNELPDTPIIRLP